MATVQQQLSRVWADTGGTSYPGDAKYTLGWISEIPTFEDFNYVLQTTTKNILSLAENDVWAWSSLIDYTTGARVYKGVLTYHCHSANTNQDPELDTTRQYWKVAPSYGVVAGIADKDKGLHLNTVDVSVLGTWAGSSQTITAARPTLALNTSGATDNHLLSNISGFLCTVNVGNVQAPDNRNVAIGQSGVHKVFHEGNPPVQAEVAGTVEEALQDGKLYARRNAAWALVTSTTVSISPPPPVVGGGTGWYNLDDGIMYIDIDDGTSSQWVPVAPARAIQSDSVIYDPSGSSLTATTMQGAIDELAAFHP